MFNKVLLLEQVYLLPDCIIYYNILNNRPRDIIHCIIYIGYTYAYPMSNNITNNDIH